jgi:hypothetical protein
MILTTPGARRITVTAEPLPDLGRVVYRVAKVGAFTLDRDPHSYPDRTRSLRCTYGVYDTDRWAYSDDLLPEHPRLFGVDICGAAVYDPDRFTERMATEGRTWRWPLPARRPAGRFRAVSVPDGTAHRLTDIVGALTLDYLDRPDRAALEAAQDALHAPTRLAGHRRVIDRLREQITALQGELDAEQALADRQAALLPAPTAT